MKRIVILGVGNVLFSDEGVGIKALEELKENFIFPENVELIDGGTLGIGLMPYLEGVNRLIILDAVLGGGPPGRVYEFKGEQIRTMFSRKVSMHNVGLQDVLYILDFLDRIPEEMVLIGVEPKSLSLGCSLSPVVRSSLEMVVEKVLKHLDAWNIKPVRRSVACSQGSSE